MLSASSPAGPVPANGLIRAGRGGTLARRVEPASDKAAGPRRQSRLRDGACRGTRRDEHPDAFHTGPPEKDGCQRERYSKGSARVSRLPSSFSGVRIFSRSASEALWRHGVAVHAASGGGFMSKHQEWKMIHLLYRYGRRSSAGDRRVLPETQLTGARRQRVRPRRPGWRPADTHRGIEEMGRTRRPSTLRRAGAGRLLASSPQSSHEPSGSRRSM
jgi:hypothetical protein